MATKPPGESHVSDPWILTQRWARAIAKAQAGEPYELAHMVVFEGPPPPGFRDPVLMALRNPAPVRRDGRKLKVPDFWVSYIRSVVQQAPKNLKRITVDRLSHEFGVSPRTIDDVVARRKAYARRVWRMKPIAKP